MKPIRILYSRTYNLELVTGTKFESEKLEVEYALDPEIPYSAQEAFKVARADVVKSSTAYLMKQKKEGVK